MLAQVDERETERRGVAPADRAVPAADVREDVCRHHGGAEVKGWHCGKRVPGQRIVKRPPEPSPVVLAGVDHDPPDRLEVAVLRRPTTAARWAPPSRRRSPRSNVAAICAAARGNRSGLAPEHVRDRRVRDEEPAPVDPRQPQVVAAHHPLAPAEAPLEPDGRRHAAAERAVDRDRVVDPQPAQERLGVVVRHLVVRDVREHLQRSTRRRRAAACAGPRP